MIEFKGVYKAYKDKEVLHGIDLTIPDGEIVSIIGSSGCGKTTMLKMINRLISITKGSIIIDGQDIQQIDPVALRLQMGYVVQDTGLFVHMTIKENLALVLQLHKVPKGECEEKIETIMKLVGLSQDLLDRYPPELSGGQQQRVGVARALIAEPHVILMDEPFSALDPITREQLQDEMRALQTKIKKTIVFVTHDMDEAIKISDRICLMREGTVEQFDTPENMLRHPRTKYVEEFIGKNRIWSSPEMIKAKDIMIRASNFCHPHDNIVGCLKKMQSLDREYMVVLDSHTWQLLGVVTLKALQSLSDLQGTVERLIEPSPLMVKGEDSLPYIIEESKKRGASFITVIDDEGHMIGLITQKSLLATLGNQYTQDGEVSH